MVTLLRKDAVPLPAVQERLRTVADHSITRVEDGIQKDIRAYLFDIPQLGRSVGRHI